MALSGTSFASNANGAYSPVPSHTTMSFGPFFVSEGTEAPLLGGGGGLGRQALSPLAGDKFNRGAASVAPPNMAFGAPAAGMNAGANAGSGEFGSPASSLGNPSSGFPPNMAGGLNGGINGGGMNGLNPGGALSGGMNPFPGSGSNSVNSAVPNIPINPFAPQSQQELESAYNQAQQTGAMATSSVQAANKALEDYKNLAGQINGDAQKQFASTQDQLNSLQQQASMQNTPSAVGSPQGQGSNPYASMVTQPQGTAFGTPPGGAMGPSSMAGMPPQNMPPTPPLSPQGMSQGLPPEQAAMGQQPPISPDMQMQQLQGMQQGMQQDMQTPPPSPSSMGQGDSGMMSNGPADMGAMGSGGASGGVPLPALNAMLVSNSPNDQVAAMGAIAQQGRGDQSTYQGLISLLQSNQPALQEPALRTLGSLYQNQDAMVPINQLPGIQQLQGILQNKKGDPSTKAGAIMVIGSRPDGQLLLKAAKNDKRPQVQTALAQVESGLAGGGGAPQVGMMKNGGMPPQF